MSKTYQFDVLIIGSGAAGLMGAIQLSEDLSIALIAKDKLLEGSSYYAQGGISAVLDSADDFNSHIQDTIKTGFELGNEAKYSIYGRTGAKRDQRFRKSRGKIFSAGQKNTTSLPRVVIAPNA